ncbi:hypothetical protein BC940DRAFT_317444 [Gongronella butleri]|nr:hypothetical protein BC940DRAFT_317444 [Gongronella butleri]
MGHFKRRSQHRDASVDSQQSTSSKDQSASAGQDRHSLTRVPPSYFDPEMRDAPRPQDDGKRQQSALSPSTKGNNKKKRGGKRVYRQADHYQQQRSEPHHHHRQPSWPPRPVGRQSDDLRQLIPRRRPQHQQQQNIRDAPFSGVQEAVGSLMEDTV